MGDALFAVACVCLAVGFIVLYGLLWLTLFCMCWTHVWDEEYGSAVVYGALLLLVSGAGLLVVAMVV